MSTEARLGVMLIPSQMVSSNTDSADTCPNESRDGCEQPKRPDWAKARIGGDDYFLESTHR